MAEQIILDIPFPIAYAKEALGLTKELIRDSRVALYTFGLHGADDSLVSGIYGNYDTGRNHKKIWWALRVDYDNVKGYHINANKIVYQRDREIERISLCVKPPWRSESEDQAMFLAQTQHLTTWTGYDKRAEYIALKYTTEMEHRDYFARRVQSLWSNEH
ncbi:hypothetical protein BO79DRAFT_191301 [Aspergillus costaricaensis CBS 115574]|uniref:Uncharacterized protein n=1 Tax=Aspergillus costaricaensis CBS 115574 TaxID=1448317 RepID=A0ACD1ILL2_9EURO|nr:hypothetical protein BO79DRAFT_191301 [Aspergillus costaricaensis CBS 115574]RAK91284.1 hypothetical protein BO79DRAFT_191301 [Aspergillus costaricaensis CBS 115574]